MKLSVEEIFKIQAKFNLNFINPVEASDEEKTAYTKEMILHSTSELYELLQSSGQWKQFRNEQQSIVRSGVLEEAVDSFKFLLNVLIVHGITYEEFCEEFYWKSKVVEARYQWETELEKMKHYDKIAAIDLDGVLAAYPESWIDFINDALGTTYTIRSIRDFSLMFPEIDRAKYEYLKHKFRDCGYESAKVFPFVDASASLNRLKDLGYKIVILSARPYKIYKRIQTDTLRWLNRNHIPFDAFIWSAEKHVEIMKALPNMSFMIEDNPRIAMQVASCGYHVYLRNRPYNQDCMDSNNITRVSSLFDVVDDTVRRNHQW